MISTLFCLSASAQVGNLVAGGVAYNPAGSPQIGGTFLDAQRLTDSTYAITVADVLPTSLQPLRTQTNITSGVAQKVKEVAGIPVYLMGSVGMSTTAVNTGWAWVPGVGVPLRLPGAAGEKGWFAIPNFRVVNANTADRAYIISLMFGWGK
jgi:hypothetical protein